MKCNLVLSGGGTRGYAHIGVVKALLEKGFTINAISGASSGAIIGAFLCDGFSPDEIADLLLRYEPELGLNYTGFWKNLLSFEPYEKVLRDHIKSSSFESLQKPLYVNVTDLDTGEMNLINSGNLVETLVASAAIPALLPARYLNGKPYADGGLSNNLPVKPFIGAPQKIIGVHVNPIGTFDNSASVVKQIDRSLHMLMRTNISDSIAHCHVFIEPPALGAHHLFESGKTLELIDIGYNYVMRELDLSLLKNTL